MGTEENLYPRISESLTQVGAKFPECLSRDFVRILQRIELLWGEKEAIGYLDSLFLEDLPDDKENLSLRSEHHTTRTRQGFPIEVVTEIVLLKQVHQLLFPSTSLNPYDPFSGSEIVPIEQTAKVDTHSESVSAGEASNDSAAVHSGSANTGKKHQIDWPVIRTPHELTEIAKLQRKGENIYPLQGKPVGEILLHYGVIDENTLRVVRDMQKRPSHKNRPIGEILVEVGIIQQDELTHTLLIQAGIPMVDVLSIDIPPEISKAVPLAKTREKLAIPIGHYRDTLYLAVSDPFTFADQSFFTVMTGEKVKPVFAPMHEITSYLDTMF